MNGFYLSPRYYGMLLLLPCFLSIRAQSVGLEYWFDKYSSPKFIDMPEGGSLKSDIDVSNLTQGFHTIYIRAKASDGTCSPITTSSFIKFAASGDSKLEYWFDNDVTNLASLPIDVESGVVQLLDLDMTDSAKFPNGVHQLSMRVAAYGGHYSPIYSALVLKLPAGTGNSVLEYWFDDNIEELSSIPIDITSGNLQKLDLEMNNFASFPLGFHKLSMRIVAYGCQYSSVYSAYVMRLPNGQTNELTYWLDDDYQNGRHVIKAKKIEGKDVLFDVAINLSSVAPGMHRFKYRIATNGFDDGVVYEVPVLITKRYNNQQWDVSVVGESRWVDEMASPVPLALSNPQSQITRSYVLNPDDYSNGQHVFYVQYKNSADVWSATNATYFYKEAATGRLVKGIMPDIEDDITDTEMSELMSCVYYNGTVIVDCQSPRLASEGKLIVCDLTGRVLAQEKVENINGIHAEVSVPSKARQLLVVKLVSGSVAFTKKLVGR